MMVQSSNDTSSPIPSDQSDRKHSGQSQSSQEFSGQSIQDHSEQFRQEHSGPSHQENSVSSHPGHLAHPSPESLNVVQDNKVTSVSSYATTEIEASETRSSPNSPDSNRSTKTTFWRGMVDQATRTAQTVSGAAQGLVQTTAETTHQTTQTLTTVAQEVVKSTAETAATTADTVTQKGKAIANATTQTSKTVVSSISTSASSIGNSIGEGTSQAGKAMINTVTHATNRAGKAMEWVNDRAHFRHFTRAIKVDWLMGIIDTVNVDSVETRVQELKHQYPDATPYQLAGRIMTKKSLIVGGSGLASSVLPGVAAAMIAFDLAATTAIQAEMGYEIAAVYGLDVHDPARKGEILAIFGLALGSSQALKTGFKYLARNVPVAGAVVGASTNAVALYAVGHAACQFYETRLNETPQIQSGDLPNDQSLDAPAMDEPATEHELAAVECQQQRYFEEASAQQIIMDQIFAHLLKAGHPDKTWPQLLTILADFHFNPASLHLISQYLEQPSDLDTLIAQVNPEFAIPLVAQCKKLVHSHHPQTPEEKRLLATITATLLPSES